MSLSALQTVQQVKTEWESAVDSVPQLICVLRKDGVVLRTNRTIEHWGLGKVSSVSGKPLHDLMHPGCNSASCYLKRFLALTNKVLATGEAVEYRGLDGVLDRNFLIQLIPVGTSETAAPSQMVIVFLDINQMNLANLDSVDKSRWQQIRASKTSEIAAQSNKAKLLANGGNEIDIKGIEKIKLEWESAVDSLPQIICLVNSDGSIGRANRAIEEWKLGKVSSVKGRKLHDMLHPGCTDANCYLHGFNQLIDKVLATEQGTERQERDIFSAGICIFRLMRFRRGARPKVNLWW